jgi:hypothetical protein
MQKGGHRTGLCTLNKVQYPADRVVSIVTWFHKIKNPGAYILMWLKPHRHKEHVWLFQMHACICHTWDCLLVLVTINVLLSDSVLLATCHYSYLVSAQTEQFTRTFLQTVFKESLHPAFVHVLTASVPPVSCSSSPCYQHPSVMQPSAWCCTPWLRWAVSPY